MIRRRGYCLLAFYALWTLLMVPGISKSWADTGPLLFDDGQSHMVTDNIVTNTGSALTVKNSNTTATMNDLSITVWSTETGMERGRGAYARDNGSITLNNVVIKNLGLNGHGVGSYFGGMITMNGGSLYVTSLGGDGAHVENASSSIVLNDVSIVVNNNSSSSEALSVIEGTITMNNGNIVTTGSENHAVMVTSTGVASLNNVAIQSAGIAFSLYDEGQIRVRVDGQSIIGREMLFDSSYRRGIINIVAENGSWLYGITRVGSASTGNITLNSNATWTTPGDSNLTNLIFGSGHFRFTAPTGDTYRTLTVRNLSGNNGTFHLNSDLHAGTSDRVYIENSASAITMWL